jgi:hypothetical protein
VSEQHHAETAKADKIQYFMPNQVVLLADHDNNRDLTNTQIADRFRGLLIQLQKQAGSTNSALSEFLTGFAIDPKRVSTFRFPDRPPFSLAFASRGTPPDNYDPKQGRNYLDYLLTLYPLVNKGGITEGGFTLRSVGPNWMSGGAPHLVSGGGPGARPISADPTLPAALRGSSVGTPGWPFGIRFDTTGLQPGSLSPTDVELSTLSGKPAMYSNVEVAILDTAPSPSAIQGALVNFPNHPLLQSLLVVTGESSSLALDITYCPASIMSQLVPPIRTHEGYIIFGHNYRMSDHGLFVAGIIHTIAPDAKLHLIQVLSDFGIGSLEALAYGFNLLLPRLQSSNPLIINCSLMISSPVANRCEVGATWLPSALESSFLNYLLLPVRNLFDGVRASNAQVVAAAGNDGSNGIRPAARYPAAFSGVEGVGALDSLRQPAEYSNISDLPGSAGITTFGGEIVVAPTSNCTEVDKTSPNGILGIYIGGFPDDTVPPDGDGFLSTSANTAGWARWAGTSFAAPIISGFLAAACGQGHTPPTIALGWLKGARLKTNGIEPIFPVIQ